MTWQECRDTSLQKLFQCYNGPDEDEATLRYLAAMPAAANEGIALLCAARPLRGVAELPEGTLEADLGSLAADYGGMGQPEVFCTGGGRLSRVEGWALLGGRMLKLPQGVPGRVLVGYDRTPPRLKDPKPEDRLELAEDAAVINGDITLIGRSDPGFLAENRTEIRELLEKTHADPDTFWLVEDHQPLGLAKNAAAGVDLTVSGHTHARQIFPIGLLDRLVQFNEMNYGCREQNGMYAVVTSGICGWGYPIRTEAHSEYVWLEIGGA